MISPQVPQSLRKFKRRIKSCLKCTRLMHHHQWHIPAASPAEWPLPAAPGDQQNLRACWNTKGSSCELTCWKHSAPGHSKLIVLFAQANPSKCAAQWNAPCLQSSNRNKLLPWLSKQRDLCGSSSVHSPVSPCPSTQTCTEATKPPCDRGPVTPLSTHTTLSSWNLRGFQGHQASTTTCSTWNCYKPDLAWPELSPGTKRNISGLTWDLQQQQVEPSWVQSKHPLLCVGSFVLAHVHKVMQHGHQGLVGQAVLSKQGPDILRQNRNSQESHNNTMSKTSHYSDFNRCHYDQLPMYYLL